MSKPLDSENLVLRKDGSWASNQTEILHERTVRLFSRSLVREGESYSLQIGREKIKVTIEDTAYFVLRIDGNPASGFELTLSDQTREPLRPETLRFTPNRLTCQIKEGRETAKFLHSSYHGLLEFLGEQEGRFFLEIRQKRYFLDPPNHAPPLEKAR